jgi:hypothetical protein
MIKNEQSLLQKNRLAAAFTDLTIEALKEFREQFIGQMKSTIPTANDVNAYNLHRALGRLEAIDFLIAEAERANKPQN